LLEEARLEIKRRAPQMFVFQRSTVIAKDQETLLTPAAVGHDVKHAERLQ
jgi:hypothetical protein